MTFNVTLHRPSWSAYNTTRAVGYEVSQGTVDAVYIGGDISYAVGYIGAAPCNSTAISSHSSLIIQTCFKSSDPDTYTLSSLYLDSCLGFFHGNDIDFHFWCTLLH
jgi:hypothetical protein